MEADDAALWERFRAVARTGEPAWGELLAAVEPELLSIARRQPIGRLREREDSPHEIVTRVFARLHAREFAAIKKLCERDPAPVLRAWLRVIVRRSAIDYMRESPEYERATARRPDRWVSLASLTSQSPAPAPDSIIQKRRLVLTTVRDMVARVAAEHKALGDEAFTRLAAEWKIGRIHIRRLATKGEQLVAVLVAVLEGRSQAEIAASSGLTPREVELTVRYLEDLLKERLAERD